VTGPGPVEVARTLLFVPGHRPDRFDKAAAAGADAVVLDLEDAVAADAKDAARAAVVGWLRTAVPGVPVLVRVNAAGTPWHADDVAALASLPTPPAALVLPMAEPGEALTALGAGPVPVVALVETAAAVLDARAVAATPGVVRLALGSFDLAGELGVDPLERAAIDPARTALVYASAAAGLPGPVDGVRGAVDDEAGLREETVQARRLGLTGKLCIHPRQVGLVAEVLRPSADEVAWARRIADAGVDGVATVDGQMVDKPVVDRALRILQSLPKENR